MFLGHYGVALGTKRAAPRTSLGTLVFAAQWLDELWPILLLLGIEKVRIAPGLMKASALDFVSYPVSHSLLTATGWALLIGGGYYLLRRRAADAWVVGAAVLSHWLLDVPVHRPDLPLWPGSSVRVGLGAWNSIALTLILELGIFGLGLLLYLRATRARDRIGRWGLAALVAVLLLIFLGGVGGAPPPSERVLAWVTLTIWVFIPWAWWVDRHREPRSLRDDTRAPHALEV